jgi:hypothetical protein
MAANLPLRRRTAPTQPATFAPDAPDSPTAPPVRPGEADASDAPNKPPDSRVGATDGSGVLQLPVVAFVAGAVIATGALTTFLVLWTGDRRTR